MGNDGHPDHSIPMGRVRSQVEEIETLRRQYLMEAETAFQREVERRERLRHTAPSAGQGGEEGSYRIAMSGQTSVEPLPREMGLA